MPSEMPRSPASMKKQQAAVDFMISYGIALLILAVAIYVILALGILSNNLSPSYCYSAPGFACDAVAVYPNGTMIAVLSQQLGGTINIIGAGCSTAINATGNGPQYGNSRLSNSIWFLVDNTLQTSSNVIPVSSGTPFQVNLPCFSSPGTAPATPALGSVFGAYVWFRYTYSGLPNSYNSITRAVEFTQRIT